MSTWRRHRPRVQLTLMLRQCSVAASVVASFCGLHFMTTKKTINLEKSLADLEKLVEELENGDLPLDKAMQKFEEGIKLTRNCQAALKEAEQKVEILLKNNAGEAALETFDADD
jgi:exodeoxyribonuclease VII small subunit